MLAFPARIELCASLKKQIGFHTQYRNFIAVAVAPGFNSRCLPDVEYSVDVINFPVFP